MLTVTESNDVNIVLDWLLDLPRGGKLVTDDQAQGAAERLADSAYKRLSAGLNSDAVATAFPVLQLQGRGRR